MEKKSPRKPDVVLASSAAQAAARRLVPEQRRKTFHVEMPSDRDLIWSIKTVVSIFVLPPGAAFRYKYVRVWTEEKDTPEIGGPKLPGWGPLSGIKNTQEDKYPGPHDYPRDPSPQASRKVSAVGQVGPPPRRVREWWSSYSGSGGPPRRVVGQVGPPRNVVDEVPRRNRWGQPVHWFTFMLSKNNIRQRTF